MRLRLGIPLTLGLWIAVASIQNWTGTPAYAVASGIIGVGVAIDIWGHRLEPIYDTRFPLHPLGALIAIGLGWPITLPWYWSVRYRIRTGSLVPSRPPQWSRAWIAVGLLVGVGLALIPLLIPTSPLMATLQAVAVAVQKEHAGQLSVSLNDRGRLQVILYADTASVSGDSARTAYAFKLALTAWRAYPDSTALHTVGVVFRRVSAYGPATVSRDVASYTWKPADMHQSVPPN